MKGYFYIMANGKKSSLHTGVCIDLVKMVNFYKKLSTIVQNQAYLLKLVYVEEYTEKSNAEARFKEVSAMNIKQVDEIINAANPEWIELVIGQNIQI